MLSVKRKPIALVVGASRGIGRQIAVDLAKNGCSVVVAAKSTGEISSTDPFPPDPNSSRSTVNTVAREIHEAGGDVLAVAVDTRDADSVQAMVDETIKAYKNLDVLVYNSGAIWWSSIATTPYKRYRLMQSVNADGLYATVLSSLPHLTASPLGGRIVVVSPPIYSRFFRGKTAYAMGKTAMSVLTKGLAMDFERQGLSSDGSSLPGKGDGRRQRGMAITSLWPAAAIESAATAKFTTTDPSELRDLRKATIFSDAVLAILTAPARAVNGQLELDEDVLRRLQGFRDEHFDKYAVVPGCKPRRIMPAVLPDLSVAEENDEGKRYDSALAGKEKQRL